MADFKLRSGKKKGKAAVSRGKMPTKRTINLAPVGVERIDPKIAAAGIALIVLFAVLFSKFFVTDRLMAMARANREVHEMRSELKSEYEKIASFGDLEDEYAHYTFAGMSEEELSLVDRAAVIQMIQKETENAGDISWSLGGNILTLTVSGRDLQAINQLARSLEAYDLVNTCSVTTATKEEVGSSGRLSSVSGVGSTDKIVRANIIVYLQNETEGDE